MATVQLDQRRVDALRPRRRPYDVRDHELKGFGIRVLPTGGKRYFIHSQHDGRRFWKIVGRADEISAEDARSRARGMLAAIRSDGEVPSPAVADIPFEDVAEEVFRRYARNWKPSTLEVNRRFLRNTVLPWFGGRPIGGIGESDVRQWLASLHNTPVAADRSAPILSVIMRQAEVYGYRREGTNPCKGIRRYRRQGRERFLSEKEIGQLGMALARHDVRQPMAVAILRLLLLTGCRKAEILSLKWSFYREGNLYLPDSKTGPRTVPLNAPARAVLERQRRGEGEFVFPSLRNPQLPRSGELWLWYAVRKEAGLEDVRLHDLRHSYASQAVLQGIPLPAVARLLGHRHPRMTLRYAHVGDRETEAAAERIGTAIDKVLMRAMDGAHADKGTPQTHS